MMLGTELFGGFTKATSKTWNPHMAMSIHTGNLT